MSAWSAVNNLPSLSAQLQVRRTQGALNTALGRLSSGLRLNSSGDDAAGLALANRFRSDITILHQGIRNANDGLSTLQIIDGGLKTVSSLLDRAATLATQSASDTFAGDRDILQAEFSKILSEITRQAQNIGLNNGGRYNQSLSVVVGGGNDSFSTSLTNQGVEIDLSGASNRIDATSLGLADLDISARDGIVEGIGGIDFTSSSATLTSAENLTFQIIADDGTLQSFTVALSAGQSATSVLNQLQSDSRISYSGITVEVEGTQLQFKSSRFFAVVSDQTNANQTGIGDFLQISSRANTSSLVAVAAGAASTQAIDFAIGDDITQVSFATTTSAATNAANIVAAINANATLRHAGIFAMSDSDVSDTYIFIASTRSSFSAEVQDAASGAADNATSESGELEVVTGSGSGPRAALDAISAAVSMLGQVQGVVGAGMNRLLQAIELATSQNNNFQAAESRIRDADVIREASHLARLSVLQQAGLAALSQANAASQGILALLR